MPSVRELCDISPEQIRIRIVMFHVRIDTHASNRINPEVILGIIPRIVFNVGAFESPKLTL